MENTAASYVGRYLWWSRYDGTVPLGGLVHRIDRATLDETPGGGECFELTAACGYFGFTYGTGEGSDHTSTERPQGIPLCPYCFFEADA
jgi:hypothetical protein